MKVSVLGTGNVGIAIAADLSIKGNDVTLIKTSDKPSESFERLKKNGNRVHLKENGKYTETYINKLTYNLADVMDADVIFITIQSIYHEQLAKRLVGFLCSDQVVVIVCSYMSSFFLTKNCGDIPMIAETTGPYLEGRVELNDKPDEVVFRVGCRLTRSPLSVFHKHRADECMAKLKTLYVGFSNDYSIIESALLNPNLVIHTCGAVMSIPRIEYCNGNFCMYREAYSRKNQATINVMFKLDEEKKKVLIALNSRPIDILEAGGFLKGMDSFYEYSESIDRAISPTSVHSRYITEDVSQGLVLLESIAKRVGVDTPITTSLIDLAGAALGTDFRKDGRTIERLCAVRYIDHLSE